jgi:hypothetical protein
MADPHRLIVGARGWDHPGWNGKFYPEDLPQDWRLSYYANEFSGVLVPKSIWQTSEPELIANWCDDVPDDFLFFLEASDSHALAPLRVTCRDLFGQHWGGIPVTNAAVMSADEKWDMRSLRVRFDALVSQPQGAAVPGFFLCGDPPNIGHMRAARLLADML